MSMHFVAALTCRFRILLAPFLLLFTIPVSPAAAQAPISGPLPSVLLSSSHRSPLKIELTQPTDSLQGPAPPTHWKEGALVGGLLGAVGGTVLGLAICRNSEELGKNCAGRAVAGGLISALVLAIPGALIGGQISKGSATE
jgi:hypothetical protein